MALTTNALITLYTGESNGTLLTTLNDIASSIALNYIHWLPTQRTEMFWLTEGRTGKFSLPVLKVNSVLAAFTGIDSCIKMSANYTASISKPTEGTAQVLKIVNLGTMAVTSHTLAGTETISAVYTLIVAVDTAATLTSAYSALSVKRIHPCGPTDVISCITDRCDVKGYNEGGTVDLYWNRASNYAPVAVFADVGYSTLPQDLQTGVALIARNLWMRNKVAISEAMFFGTKVGDTSSTKEAASQSTDTGTGDGSSTSTTTKVSTSEDIGTGDAASESTTVKTSSSSDTGTGDAESTSTSTSTATNSSSGSSTSTSSGSNDSASKSQGLTDYSGSVAESTGTQSSESGSMSVSAGEQASNSSSSSTDTKRNNAVSESAENGSATSIDTKRNNSHSESEENGSSSSIDTKRNNAQATSTETASSLGHDESKNPVYAMIRHLFTEPIGEDAKALLGRYKLYDSWFVGSSN